jgi:hypothetical protein
MTTRLRLSDHDRGWSELFQPAYSLRKMRVMADAELLGDDRSSWTAENLLAGLLTHKDIQFWRYSDQGPAPGIPTVSSMSGQPVAVGWVVTEEGAPLGERTTHSVAWAVDMLGHRMGLPGEPVLAASTDSRTKAYETLDPDDARAQRIADAVAACAARQVKADLYVTDREYLHRLTHSIGEGVTFCTTTKALALVGLYLRSQGNFLIWKDSGDDTPYRFDKGLYYWVGARELLPAGWRWFTACVMHDEQTQASGPGINELTYLGGAVFQRITRVLQARDDLMRAMNCKQDNNVAGDALTALDICLVFLMGAVDATARVAHRVLDLPLGIRQAAWQNPAWVKQVAAKAPALADVVVPKTPGADALTILRLLRNTVHDAGLPALAVGYPARRRETLVGLPSADRDQILKAADRQGGRQTWGLRELLPGRLHADPDIFFERLLPAIIELLNNLMTETPVETLPGVSLKSEHLFPPRDISFGEHERQSIRWQLGL